MSAANNAANAASFDPHFHVGSVLKLNDERDEILKRLVEIENRMQPHLRALYEKKIRNFKARGEIVKIRSREQCEWKRCPISGKIEKDAQGKRIKLLGEDGKPKIIGIRYTMSVPSSEEILEFDV